MTLTVDEIAAHLGVGRIQSPTNREPDASLKRRIDLEIAKREAQGLPMPVAAPTLTPVQQAIKATILAETASKDDVPLRDIVVAFGTPPGELRDMLPVIARIIQPVLRRLVLDGVIVIRDDDRPQGQRPEGVRDPFEGLRLLVSRARPALVAAKNHDRVDLLYDATANVAYVRTARLSYDRIVSGLASAELTRVVVPGENIALDYDAEDGLVGLRVMNANERFTQDTLDTATMVTL